MVVVPLLMPVTSPAALTVATSALLLLHMPPAVAQLSGVLVPMHIAGVPVMAAVDDGATVNVCVTEQPV
jgi:hypothetical protein